ncbi:hypothetical protein L210DRAFT_2278017 [Boletus edulis BED1]|uniref:Uncharacterized protein n=1 Tax=Boletus edulis BED1 TaxID=1328754 RepID=A0AAD4BSE6_BOLED|nr:hypothetical protein L210DRAFT_2278017 [Boletus edulis BED1]
MGKSRVVDQMARTHFVIPVNLREPRSSGYPPPDKLAHEYLVGSHSQEVAFLRSCSFLHELFLRTTNIVKQMDKHNIAHQFRQTMNDGMTHGGHSKSRKTFYKDIDKDSTGTNQRMSNCVPMTFHCVLSSRSCVKSSKSRRNQVPKKNPNRREITLPVPKSSLHLMRSTA